MPQLLTPAVLGAIVRDTRLAAGLSQTALGARIGASRFWVAEFEQGKPTTELGLALKAVHALGITLRVTAGPHQTADTPEPVEHTTPSPDLPVVDLGALIAAASGTTTGTPTGIPIGTNHRRTRDGIPRGKAGDSKPGWPASTSAPPR